MQTLSDNSIHFQAIVPALYNGVLGEALHRAPGGKERLPARITQQFTLYLCQQLPFQYHYRRSHILAPPRRLAVFQPDEMLSGEDTDARTVPTVARLLYLPVAALQQAAEELTGKAFSQTPSFAETVIQDERVALLYLAAQTHIACASDTLATDTALFRLLQCLLISHASVSSSSLERRKEAARIRRACDYLHDNFARNVSLKELADSVELSLYHFHRLFQRQLGLTPYAYLQNIRIGRARLLLTRGVSVGETAQETGFADESHFIRRFRHLVGITPGRYAAPR